MRVAVAATDPPWAVGVIVGLMVLIAGMLLFPVIPGDTQLLVI